MSRPRGRGSAGLLAAFAFALALALACGGGAPAPAPEPDPVEAVAGVGPGAPGPIVLREAADVLAPAFVHEPGETGRRLATEIMGAGVAVLDADGDGDLDLYLVQGGELPLASGAPPQGSGDRLYLNRLAEDGRLAFVDSGADLGPPGYGMGAATGDVDGDGRTDLYVTRLDRDRLLVARGDGTFVDATDRSGIDGDGWSASAAFVDLDRDGDLDLYVTRYVEHPARDEEGPRCTALTGALDYCGPLSFPPVADRLWRNRGDGTFEEAGVGTIPAAPGLGVVAGDWDADGRPDLYVANDGRANLLWTTDPADPWRLVERGVEAGAALSGEGQAQAGMGIAVGDAEGDGDEDLLITHLDRETNTLYRNRGGYFDDASAASGLGAPSWSTTGFGAVFADFDLDGRPDLAVANGAVYRIQALVDAGDPRPLHQPNLVFANRGDGTFEALSTPGVADFTGPSEVSRGLAAADLDDDGDPDLVLTNNGGPARIYLAEAPAGAAWVGLRVLLASGADALSSRVELEGPGPFRTVRVRTAASYLSASDPRVVFGLGEGGEDGRSGERTVRVTWPAGATERFVVEVGRYTTLREGEGSRDEG